MFLDKYLAARFGPSFLWNLDWFWFWFCLGLGLGLGLLQSNPLSPTSKQSASGSPWSSYWPSRTGQRVLKPAISLSPSQLQIQWRGQSKNVLTNIIKNNLKKVTIKTATSQLLQKHDKTWTCSAHLNDH